MSVCSVQDCADVNLFAAGGLLTSGRLSREDGLGWHEPFARVRHQRPGNEPPGANKGRRERSSRVAPLANRWPDHHRPQGHSTSLPIPWRGHMPHAISVLAFRSRCATSPRVSNRPARQARPESWLGSLVVVLFSVCIPYPPKYQTGGSFQATGIGKRENSREKEIGYGIDRK